MMARTKTQSTSKLDSILSSLHSKIKDATESSPSAKSAVVSLVCGACVVSITLGALFYKDVLKHRHAQQPLRYKPVRRQDAMNVSDRSNKDIVKDRFVPGKTKIPEDVDYIIIGSGIGGLSCAAFLSKAGKKCLVLEQHDRLGGCMHQFDRTFAWDVGIHYIGRKEKYENILKCITDPQSPAYPINMVQMGNESDGHTFDKYVIGTGPHKFEFSARADKRMDDLRNLFKDDPQQLKLVNTLDKYLQDAKMLFMFPTLLKILPSFVGKLMFWIVGKKYGAIWNKSVTDVLKDLKCDDNLLAMIIFAMIGNMGGPRSQQPFVLFASLFGHFNEGGFYFEGGPQQVTRAIMPVIEKAGGRSIANAGVSEILFNDAGRAIGVKVDRAGKNFNFYARRGVISAAGFRVTFSKLAPIEKLLAPASYKKAVSRALNCVHASVQHFHIYLGFNKTSEELGLPSHNRWVFRFSESETKAQTFDYDKFWKEWNEDPLHAAVFGFIGFPSAKDPKYEEKCGNKSICVIVTECPRTHFKQWDGEKKTTTGARGEEYENFKKKIGDRLVEELVFKDFPQLRECLEKKKYGTALSGEHYLGNMFGESYGLQGTLERMFDTEINYALKPKTPVKGLYITGQDVVCPGWAGALAAGQITAESILGYYDSMATIVSGRNICRDIQRMDKMERK